MSYTLNCFNDFISSIIFANIRYFDTSVIGMARMIKVQKTPRKKHWTRRCKQWRKGSFQQNNPWSGNRAKNVAKNVEHPQTSDIQQVKLPQNVKLITKTC